MPLVYMIMGAVFFAMVVIVNTFARLMLMGVLVLMFVFMGMDVAMLVAMLAYAGVLVFMFVFMGMRVGMVMVVFVVAFHSVLLFYFMGILLHFAKTAHLFLQSHGMVEDQTFGPSIA